MMWNIRCWLVFLAALMLTFSAVSAPSCVLAVDKTDAGSAIADAEGRIVLCYQAVADADRAGANVTDLLAVLNESGLLLSRANLAYKTGDFDSAFNFSLLSQERLDGFVVEADVLREAAVQQCYWDFMVNVVGSIVGAVVVVCGGFAVWFLLKRRYGKVGSVV
jgi:hypothetical protein